MLSGRCKSKRQSDTTHYPPSRMVKICNIDICNTKCYWGYKTTKTLIKKIKRTHSLLVEMLEGIATVEDSLVVSYKAKHTLTI